jgi:hypothetical protein
MKHPEIDEHQVVEHYVAGKLTADEEARFEEHYLDCPACTRAIEDAERLRRGLELVAAQDLTRQTIFATVARALRSPLGALLAGLLLVAALLPAGLTWRRVGRLDAELEGLRRELADERRPRINTPVIALAATRAGEQPLQRISLAAEPEWIVLAIELGDAAEPRYTAALTTAAGTVVWESPGLEPSYLGTVTLSLHSSLLPPSDYVLSLTGDRQRLRFPLRVGPLAP